MPTEKCPQCGRRGSACRSVPLGYWCQEYGLDEDKSLWIHPEPDPVAEAVRTDPVVLATTLERDTAQAAFDAADQSWQAALSRVAECRIRTAAGAIFVGPTGGMEFHPPSRRDRKREKRLQEEEAEALEERERLNGVLVKAKELHRRATVAARLAATVT